MHRPLIAFLSLLMFPIACGDGNEDPDASTADAAGAVDVGAADSATADTRAVDAAAVDANVVDANAVDVAFLDANAVDAAADALGMDAGGPGGDKLVAFISINNTAPEGATGRHQVHVVGPSGNYSYVWGNEDYVYTGNTIDMDTSDDAQLIVVGGGQGNINNKVLVFDYEGNKLWETGSNGNSQGTRFYTGNSEEPIIAVGFHDNSVHVSPSDTTRAEALGFYARDLDGILLDWRPVFPDGGGSTPFRGGGLNVWHSFADDVNNRLFVQGEFSSARTSAGARVDAPVSRLAVYEQRADGSFPEEPSRVPRFGASWFETSAATKHVGNPWTMVQTDTHYYVGGHSFDRVEDLDDQVHNVNSLVRLNIADMDLDTSWLPTFGPTYNPMTTDDSNCVVVRGLATYRDEILVGGRFDAFQGTARQNLAAFDSDTGTITTRFSELTINNGEVYSIAIDGNLAYIAGSFTSITDRNGTMRRNRLACIDLTTNTLTSWNPSSSSRVNRIRVIEAP